MYMKTNIKATNLELTGAINEYLSKKLASIEKIIDKKDGSVFAQIELAKTNNHHKGGDGMFRAEINLHVAGKDFYVFSENGDLMSAIDMMKDEITRQLHSSKDKRISFLRRSGAKVKNILKGISGRGK